MAEVVTLDTLARMLEDLIHQVGMIDKKLKSRAEFRRAGAKSSVERLPTTAPSIELPAAIDDSNSASVADASVVDSTLFDSNAMEPEPEPALIASTKSTDAASPPPTNLESIVLILIRSQILNRPRRIGCSHFIKLKTTSIRSPNNLRMDLMKHQWRPPPSVPVSRSSRYLGLRQPLPVHGPQHA